MNTTNKKFIDFTEKEMENQLMVFSKGQLSESKIKLLAKEIVSKIDWNNSSLMHKGLSWMAKNYLQQYNLQQ